MKLYCFRGFRVVGWGSLEAWKNEYLQAKKEGSPVQRMVAQLGRPIGWEEAFTRRFDFDAMICPYFRRDLPAAKGLPRMAGSALNHPDLVMGSAWIDVDNPGHAKWQSVDHARKGVDEILAKLPPELRDTVYWYATRGGVRLVWKLGEPVEARHWRSWMSQFRTMLSVQCGIHTDPCSEEYARHFRLPLVRRDGVDLDLPVGDVGERGPLPWEPVAPLEIETVSEGADPSQWPDEHPAFDPEKDTPKARDYSPLKDSEWYEPLTQPSPLGVPGERHRQIRRCVCSITAMLRSEEPARIFRLVAPSVLADKSPDAPGLRQLWDLCRWACSAQKAERISLSDMRNTIFARARKATTTQTDSDDVEDDEYDASKDDVQERIVLIIEKAHYVLHEDTGEYFGPVPRDSVYIALRQVSPSLYSLAYTNQGKKIPVNNFLERHARIVDSVVAKVGETGIRYNPVTDQIIEGICAVRADLKPVYDRDVNEWLELLGGAEKDRLLDWLATLTDLEWPTCALYIEGPKSIGKGMLADGIASLWGTKPATWSDFTASFNDQLARVPLVWADEKIPNDRFASQEASITLRQMVGNSSFTLKRKYLPSQSVTGCLRFLITANDGDALRLHEEMNRESYLAVVERIGHIFAGPQAAKWLEQKGGRAFTKDWVSEDRIAQHLLWLRDNRKVKRGSRFIVPGWESEHHVHLRGASRTAVALLEAVCAALEDTGGLPEGVWAGGGKLLVTQKGARALIAANAPFNTPDHKALANTLGSVGDTKGRVRLKNPSRKFRAYEINRWLVLNHAKKIDADVDRIREILDREPDSNVVWAEGD
jgi:hypothetical protein